MIKTVALVSDHVMTDLSGIGLYAGTFLEEIERPYRENPLYGIQFSIDSDCYDIEQGEEVSFGESHGYTSQGVMYNYQDVIYRGDVIGCLCESVKGTLLAPICTSFCFYLADWSEEWKITDEMRKSPHFYDAGESYMMRFATLKQMLDFYKKKFGGTKLNY